MDKPFAGIIRDWYYSGDRIHGACVKHTTYQNGIVDNGPITTSTVIRIFKDHKSGLTMCETRNSLYVLV